MLNVTAIKPIIAKYTHVNPLSTSGLQSISPVCQKRVHTEKSAAKRINASQNPALPARFFCFFASTNRKETLSKSCFFNNAFTIPFLFRLHKLQEHVFEVGIPFHLVHGALLYQFSILNDGDFIT